MKREMFAMNDAGGTHFRVDQVDSLSKRDRDISGGKYDSEKTAVILDVHLECGHVLELNYGIASKAETESIRVFEKYRNQDLANLAIRVEIFDNE